MTPTAELQAIKEEVTAHAQAFGLDFFPTIFEVVSLKQLNEVASYGGFPTRYPHWRFGMDFEELERGTTYGLARIYELVLNTDPCYAFLLESNSLTEQKMIMAHVLAHADFFKNNQWFAPSNRKMLDEMANHAVRVRRYMDRYGQNAVEEFLDACLSLENLLDLHAPFIRRGKEERRREADGEAEPEREEDLLRLRSKDYMDPYINPERFLEEQRRRLLEERARKGKVPERPVKDVPGFLLEHAPLESWEWDILSIVREEAYYFAPQRQTKIMNEGWATYWHSRIMTEKALGDGEVVDYAERHAGTLGGNPAVLNPYKLGVELFRDIEDRWNRGAYGPEYEECTDLAERAAWNLETGEGLSKIFEVRRVHNDVTFIDAFLTEEFCGALGLFTFQYDENENMSHLISREFQAIKERLLFSLTNFGQPFVLVEDANYRNRGELLLRHRHEGHDLRLDYARETLARLFRLWRRPVNLATIVAKRETMLSYDGKDWRQEEAPGAPGAEAAEAAEGSAP